MIGPEMECRTSTEIGESIGLRILAGIWQVDDHRIYGFDQAAAERFRPFFISTGGG